MTRRTAFLSALLPTILLSSCDGGSTGPMVVTVSVTPAVSTLAALGETVQLAAEARDAQGGAIPARTFTWSSSEKEVATVTASGLVRAIGNGTATITARTNGVSGSASISVAQGAASLTLSPSSVVLAGPGASMIVTASVTDAGGSPVANPTLAWRSEDESVAIASDAGLVTSVGVGTTTIRVEAVSGGQTVSEQLPVTVNPTLSIATTSLPDGIQDVPYTHKLTATGGDGDHVWSVVEGSLPTGMSLSTEVGEIVGTPTQAESRLFTVQVESGDGQTAQRAFSITITRDGPPATFSEDFEGGWGSWSADNGIWEVGLPTAGPNECHSGVHCAGTVLDGDYPFNGSSLVSPTIALPEIGPAEEIHLRFWHWFSLGGATGGNPDAAVVYIQERISAGVWSESTTLARYTHSSGDVWTLPLVDLSAFGGRTVRVLFDLQGNHALSTGAGWYIDDVSVVVVPSDNTLPYSDGFENGIGNWWASNGTWEVGVATSEPNECHSGVHCAGTVLDGDYPFNRSGLVSPTITLPALGPAEEIHLRFWHWFSLGGPTGGNPDAGVVYVQERVAADEWGQVTELARYTHDSGGVWTFPLIDLSAYAGRTVRILFDLQGRHAFSTGAGWYVDDVSVAVVTGT